MAAGSGWASIRVKDAFTYSVQQPGDWQVTVLLPLASPLSGNGDRISDCCLGFEMGNCYKTECRDKTV